MGQLRHWWQYLTGKPDDQKSVPPAPSARVKKPSATDELRLADGERPRRRSRLREAGFDPYANDAGFSKPHSWERVERK